MKDVRLLLELSAKMLILAKGRFDNHGCNDLDREICKLIPEEWCEEARYMNSNGTDPWPLTTEHFGDSGLMWFLSKKLESMAIELDRDNKLNELGI